MSGDIRYAIMKREDVPALVSSFISEGWSKPTTLFYQYLDDQDQGKRICWTAFYQGQFSGYVTLAWYSLYPFFNEKKIPEIMDLNVLSPFRRKGIGSALLAEAERTGLLRSNCVGIGVGLSEDYGSAQRLYVKRGYRPDGKGITYNYQKVAHGSHILLDDDLILWLIKERDMGSSDLSSFYESC